MTAYKIIDADAHMCEPPDLWLERMDQRFRDRAPRVVKDPKGKKGSFKESQQDETNLPELYVRMIVRTHEAQHSLLQLIFSGVLERFPRLKLVSAENDIAWIPHMLERADKYYRRFKQGYEVSLSLKPSEYFCRQVYATFIDDPMGLKTYQLTGSTDNFMWSTDYPHQASTWPHSQEVLARDFQGIPEEDKRKIVRENTARLYGFALG